MSFWPSPRFTISLDNAFIRRKRGLRWRCAMTELRSRMIREMTLRGYSPRTQQAYVRQVVGLVRHYRRSPEQIGNDEVRLYLAHLLQERKLSWSTCAQAAFAFRFLYHQTLGRPATEFVVPAPRQPQRLPEILSREEVQRLIEAPPNPRHRLLLATTYAAGLRVSEAVRLRVRDIDPQRMTLRIEQGKGAKDRYVPLSARLLAQMRTYWESHPPRTWLFAAERADKPMHITSAQKIWMLAKVRAGIAKTGGIHSLRHAYATHLLESGQDVHTVQRVLGHRFITSTMRYFHLSQARVNAARSPFDLIKPNAS